MKKPLIIGITGGIGAGKSTFCQLLLDKGELVYFSDKEASRIQEKDNTVIDKIKKEFGENIYFNGILQRSKLAEIVFSDTKKLQKLNQIVHPAVIDDFQQWVHQHLDRKYLFMECAILFEAKFTKYVDKIVTITASEEERIKRTILRDNISEKEVKARIKNQISENYKKAKSDWIFDTTYNTNPMKNVETLLKLLENNFGH